MFQNILILFFAFCFLTLPLVFWMYLFTSLFAYGVSRIHFLLGILTGGVLTCIFVFHERLFYGMFFSDIFLALSETSFQDYAVYLLLCLSIFYIFGVASFLMFQNSLKRFFYKTSISYLLIGILAGILSLCVMILTHFFPDPSVNMSLTFGNILFGSLGSILAYYLTLSFLEEVGKYITQLGFSGRSQTDLFQGCMVLSVSIALGFSFFENIFYSYQYIMSSGISGDFLVFVMLRSIFSTSLHLFTSLLLSLGFWNIFLSFSYKKSYLYTFFFFCFLSIAIHASFNLFLELGFAGILFVGIFGLYFFLSFMLQKPYYQQ